MAQASMSSQPDGCDGQYAIYGSERDIFNDPLVVNPANGKSCVDGSDLVPVPAQYCHENVGHHQSVSLASNPCSMENFHSEYQLENYFIKDKKPDATSLIDGIDLNASQNTHTAKPEAILTNDHTRGSSASTFCIRSVEAKFGCNNGSVTPPATNSDDERLSTPRSTNAFCEVVGHRALSAPTSTPSSPAPPLQFPEQPVRITPSSVAEIDSALLSALCDHRERWNVLRLEQVLVDFMKQRNVGFVEINPNGGAIYSSNGNVMASQQQMIGSQQPGMGGAGVGHSDQQPKHCTSFHRLCLHRLADRFNIVREAPSDGNVHGQVVNLIRLVKTKDSHIPSQLLIDLDLSEQGLKDDMNGIASLARSMSSSSLEVSGATKLTLQKQLNSGKKMMIMKRNNKDPRTSRKNESKSDGKKKKHNLKGKKMDEKEKAYAEVRARIFGESSGSTRNSSGTSSPPTRSSPGIASSPPLPEPQSQLIESDAQSSKREPRNTRMSSHNNNLNDTSREGDGGNVTKARYRNRMQEENDPDFRRGRVAVPMQYGHAYGGIYNDAYPVAASASAGVYTQGSGSGSYQHLQQTMYYSSGQQYVMGRQGYAYSQQQTQSAYHHTYYRGEQQEQSAPNEGSSDYAAIGVNGNGKSIYQNEFPELGR